MYRKGDSVLIVTGTVSLEKLSFLLPSDFCVVMLAMEPTNQRRIFDNFLAYLAKNNQVIHNSCIIFFLDKNVHKNFVKGWCLVLTDKRHFVHNSTNVRLYE